MIPDRVIFWLKNLIKMLLEATFALDKDSIAMLW
jgi:hypothetical protein